MEKKESPSGGGWTPRALLRRFFEALRGPRFRESAAALVLVSTRRCNLRCATCLKGRAAAEDLDPALLDLLLPEARKLGFDAVSLSGGEPILHPRFGELLSRIAANGMNLILVTNGLEYRRYLEALAPFREKVNFIAVSLDSHLKDINDAIRGPGSMEAAVAAAKAFKAAGYFTKVSHVVSAANLPYLPEFVDFVNAEIGPYRINIGSVISTGDNADLVLSSGQKRQLKEEIRRLSARHRNLALASSTGYFEGVMYCSRFGGFGGLTVSASGEMLFCCDNPGEGIVLGDIRRDGLAAIAAEFFRLQAAVKSALVREKLAGGPGCAYDCDLCYRLLKQARRGP